MPPPESTRHRGPCPVEAAVGAIASKWSVPVVGRLARGPARFGRIRGQVTDGGGDPVSSKVLSDELDRLAGAGVVERRERGAAVWYHLTDKGRALVPLLDALGEWAGDQPNASVDSGAV